MCKTANARTLFKKNGFPHVQCSACEFIYVSPILKDSIIDEHYRNVSNDWTVVTATPEYVKMQDAYSNFHLDHIERLSKGNSRTLLDIGCNAGDFLLHAQRRGWKVSGHELNILAVEECLRKGLTIHKQSLEEMIKAGERFDAVTFFGVFEHLIHPTEVLQTASQLLNPGGIIAALVPNIDGLATRTLREQSRTFDGIEHLNFWNRKTFSAFFEREGFNILHTETTISELYAWNNALHFDHPYSASAEHPLAMPEITPDIIHQNFLGHHLLAYAEKVK